MFQGRAAHPQIVGRGNLLLGEHNIIQIHGFFLSLSLSFFSFFLFLFLKQGKGDAVPELCVKEKKAL